MHEGNMMAHGWSSLSQVKESRHNFDLREIYLLGAIISLGPYISRIQLFVQWQFKILKQEIKA